MPSVLQERNQECSPSDYREDVHERLVRVLFIISAMLCSSSRILLVNSLGHKCRNDFRMVIEPDRHGARLCDAFVTTPNGKFWKVQEEVAADIFRCSPVRTAPFTTAELGVDVPWKTVGVAR